MTEIYSAGFEGKCKSLMYIERFPTWRSLLSIRIVEELYGLTLSNNKKLTRVTSQPAQWFVVESRGEWASGA